jgi:hypothetical protein
MLILMSHVLADLYVYALGSKQQQAPRRRQKVIFQVVDLDLGGAGENVAARQAWTA